MSINAQDPIILAESLIELGRSVDGCLERDLLASISEIKTSNAELLAALNGDWADKLYEFFLDEFGDANPDSGEVVSADALPHFKALCEFIARRDLAKAEKTS